MNAIKPVGTSEVTNSHDMWFESYGTTTESRVREITILFENQQMMHSRKGEV